MYRIKVQSKDMLVRIFNSGVQPVRYRLGIFSTATIIAFLAGCAQPVVSNTNPLSNDPTKAVIIVGAFFDEETHVPFQLRFAETDQANNGPRQFGYFFRATGWEDRKTSYTIAEIRPGSYIAADLEIGRSILRTGSGWNDPNGLFTYCHGTVLYNLEAGNVYYLGSFEVTKDMKLHRYLKIEEARLYLSGNYSDLAGRLKSPDEERVEFPCPPPAFLSKPLILPR